MNKAEVLNLLEREHIPFRLIEHPPIFTVEEGDAFNMENRDKVVRNLFLRDARKKKYFIVTLYVHKKIDLKELAQVLGTSRLSFASKETMTEWLQVMPGSVTPLAILNDTEHHVRLVFDEELSDQLVGCHPLENNATVFFRFSDLYNFLKKYRNDIQILPL